MSTPPPQPGQSATLDGQPPAASPAAPPGDGFPAPRPSKFGTHQVLWGISGLILGLLIGVLGTQAESSSGPAGGPRPDAASGRAARLAATPRPLRPGTAANGTMNGTGVFVIGQDIRAGSWHTAGAVGGRAGACHVALLGRPGRSSVLDSHVGTGPYTIAATRPAKVIQTSGCRTWHRLGALRPARSRSRPGTRNARLRP